MNSTYLRKSLIWIGSILSLFAIALWQHEGLSIQNAFLLLGLCFCCELIDSGLGMGYGTILTPTLLLIGYEAKDIVPTVLFSELLSGFTAAFFHHEIKNIELNLRGRHLKPALILASGSVAGVTAGVFLAITVSKELLNIAIGCIIFLSGLFILLLSRKIFAYRVWKMVVLSIIASFNKAVSGGGYGPLVTSGQILSGVEGKSSVGITSFAEAFTCLLGVSFFLLKGGYINLLLFIPMCTGALISVPFAAFAINKSNEDHLKLVIGFLTLTMGALTIYKAMP